MNLVAFEVVVEIGSRSLNKLCVMKNSNLISAFFNQPSKHNSRKGMGRNTRNAIGGKKQFKGNT
jgi:hypothetical protein